MRAVFLLLPDDTRLRCSEVSRAWRALLADTTFWARISLCTSSGIQRFSLPLLRAAVAKAGGRLRALDITGQPGRDNRILLHVTDPLSRLVREVVAANASTLTELCVRHFWAAEDVRTLLEEEAPLLQLLQASVVATDRQLARALLRNEPPFQALRLQRLYLWTQGSLNGSLDSIAHVVALSSDLRCHASLEKLILYCAALNTGAAMGAVVDACIALGLRKLQLGGCRVTPTTLPELTRLIAGGALRKLKVLNNGATMFDEGHESTRLFVDAVRASAMTRLRLKNVGDKPENVVEAKAFINARQR